ncbi:MAG: arginine--tRNA ligase [Deltaproteobacteria bacterium]|jgi:arginyl-tRNA synthetase|nr:arginine--tRNA ligase [Deltaproteobacteria bacterium]
MKDTLGDKLAKALAALAQKHGWPERLDLGNFVLEEPNNPIFGHLATNAAMTLAKPLGLRPRDLALMIIEAIEGQDDLIESMEIAGPGFINFRFSQAFWAQALKRIRSLGPDFGRGEPSGRRILVEYVSANPTGPLHVGHGRGAALGDALARILSFAGHDVGCEYYVNDAGRQTRILGNSVLTRLRETLGLEVEIPQDFYRGQYISEIAAELAPGLDQGFWDLPPERQADLLSQMAIERIIGGIRKDLADFRIRHDSWFSEKSLYDRDLVEDSFRFLESHGHLYRKDGALWFRSTPFGDDKDRVLVKSDGQRTYFASDIAYHKEKFDRGYDVLIDVWGADHHGYIPRVKAAVHALGREPQALGVVLVQMVNLIRDGRVVGMSTRSGEFVTLREVLDEVGPDAARFMFLTRSHESTLDFDLDLAKSQSRDNPVFYVQYVCARVNSLLAKAGRLAAEPEPALLTAKEELEIIKTLAGFPETIRSAARRLEPHVLTAFLSGLAKLFHQYYGAFRLVDDANPGLTAARLELAQAVKQVTVIGLSLLGVEAPEKM